MLASVLNVWLASRTIRFFHGVFEAVRAGRRALALRVAPADPPEPPPALHPPRPRLPNPPALGCHGRAPGD